MSDLAERVVLCLCLLIAIACGSEPRPAVPDPPAAPPPTGGRALVFGDIDANDPARKFEWLKPFADHVAARLGAVGFERGDVRIARDMATMTSWLAAGEVHVYLDSLYPAMIVCSRSGATPILRRWKGGLSEYHTVFLTTAESGVRSLGELPGRMLAFDDEASTSGFFLPVAHLRSLDLELEPYESPGALPPVDRVGYIFTGDDENSIQWLLSGRVAAAAIDNITFERDIEPATRERLVLLAETDSVPRQVVVVGPGLDPELVAELTTVLLHVHESPEGRAALESVDTARIDRFPEGAESALRRFRTTYSAVSAWLEP